VARLLRILAVVLLALAGSPLAAQTNPITGQPAAPAAEPAFAPIAAVGRALLTFQRESNRLIGEQMRAIRDGETSLPLLIGIALAFLYGVLHALGPGHGKLVVVTYFLAREARIGKGLLMGLQIAVFHVLSAIVLVALADLLLRSTLGGPAADVPAIRLASYGLIALIGGGMLVQAVRRQRLRRAGIAVEASCCGHGHGGHDHHHEHEHGGQGQTARAERGLLSLGVGMVPCTGAVLILLYALANDILLAGILLASAIALGMAITMAALGIAAVLARQAVASRVATAGNGGNGRLAVAFDYAGALMIMLLGAGLFWAALQ
jgi:ABC-type nickel/cobalt efflux system permease component RcnA